MDDLISKFSKLNVNRTLIGFSDTEGSIDTGVWDFAVMFKMVVDDSFTVVEDCHHVASFSTPKQLDHALCKKPLASFKAALYNIRDHHNCDSIVLCFWNAPHDINVLNHHDIRFDTIDLLKIARDKFSDKFSSFKLQQFSNRLGVHTDLTHHTALGDTELLYGVFTKLGLTTTELKPYLKHETTITSGRAVRQRVSKTKIKPPATKLSLVDRVIAKAMSKNKL